MPRDEIERRVKRIFAKPMTNRDYLEAMGLNLAATMMYCRDKSPEEVNERALQQLGAVFASMACNAPNEEYRIKWCALIQDLDRANAMWRAAKSALERGETKARMDS